MKPKLALICPGSRCLPHETKKVEATLSEQGYAFVSGEDCHTWLPPKARAELILSYLSDASIQCLWILRGGEGAADVIPYLHLHQAKLKNLPPKMLLGFSDFTPFLLYFAQTYGWQTVHGMAALQLVKAHLTKDSIAQTLAVIEGKRQYVIDNLNPLNDQANTNPHIEATCTGGTLSLLNISVGDVWQLDANDKILCIEDVNEKGYQIDRTLKYLQRVGCLSGVRAIVFGDFTCQPIGRNPEIQLEQQAYIFKCLERFAASCDFPVWYTAQFGHGPIHYPIIFNRKTLLSNHCLRFS